ncbi:MAG: acyl-CoA dehydrogenase family protein, partial [Chloroflexota bacterium]|nr:acyl-CoA dehydrogenase family protein [Chloroflexota bacterium]
MPVIPFAGEEERALADAARHFARDLAPRVPAAESAGTLPLDVVAELARIGVLGMTIPEADGGLGASYVSFALVLEELAAAWPALAVGVSVNSGIVAGSVVRHGTPEQKRRWLPRLIDGSGLGAFALTEPAAGSDAAALRTTARSVDGGWSLSGQKIFVTSARYAPFAIVFARVGEARAERPHEGITAFIVPLDSAGVTVGPAEHKMGLLASDTSAIVFSDVALGADGVLGKVGGGFGPIALGGLDTGRIGIAAQAVGIARGALE